MKVDTVKSEPKRFSSKKKKSVVSTFHEIEDDVGTHEMGKWYKQVPDDPEEFSKVSDAEIEHLKLEAKKLLNDETCSYTNKLSKGGRQFDYSWMRTVVNKGTASDKVAANTILIQDSPVHNVPTLKNLISLVKVGKKNECLMVIDTLTELFMADLLPPHRKLKTFESRPHVILQGLSEGNKAKRQKYLMYWFFEDQLKELYMTFVQSLQSVSHDSVDKNKEKAITAFYKLLAGNPELESVLLSNLVNKLGDPSQKVVSKVMYCLTQLLHVHPNMKGVVTEEIEKLLFRPNIKQRAQYYGLCFLTQLLFTKDEASLAVTLIKLYFSFFKACVKKGEIDSRLMSALFTGVNRAFPFARNEINTIMEHIDTLYKVVHIASFNVSLHALCLLFHITDQENTSADRYYSALYKKLVDPQIGCSSHQAAFVNLLFRSLQKDTSTPRVCAFIKRLLQLCLVWPVPLVCGVLYMISQLLVKHANILSFELKHTPKFENDGSDEEEHYDDVLEEDKASEASTNNAINNKIKNEEVKGTWFHCQNDRHKGLKKIRAYDAFQRNPLFAGGEYSVCTELRHLNSHYHPTVSLFAQKILQGEKIIYSGDPLQDFTLSRFLDRFVFKNPKKNSENSDTVVHKVQYTPTGVKSLAVTSDSYLNTDESKIPVDELFLYRYLKKKRKDTVPKDTESDIESVASEEFEEMIDSMMGVKKGDIDFANEVAGKLTSAEKKETDSDDDSDGSGADQDMDDVFDDDLDVDEDLDEDIDDGDFDDDDDDDDDDIGSSTGRDDIDAEDDDEEELVFDDMSDEEVDVNSIREDIRRKKFSLKANKKKGRILQKKGLDEEIFIPAEEFAEILEDTGTSDHNVGSISAVSTKDNADVKQLKWEAKRDMWMQQNKKWKRKRKGKQSGPVTKRRRN
ncbi:CCAAT/enhancer-binding protein zeta isoform X1 [Schistocerca piceifrons]|uniref:CCAAT/enhancer-binding protein zeta isoform X1 n=1 Tax=Schistocerca piceifrons TaxID=274613 RepID=UPI001F5EA52E|nr:CCAAT/enhancer-binding protein zeta isoform X1 [Schistocerca piceifrons]